MASSTISLLSDDELMEKITEPTISWPHNGQIFNVEIIVDGGCDEFEPEYELEREGLPDEVREVDSQVGVIYLIDKDELPKRAGRYGVRMTFWSDDSVDWETGINDPHIGFMILSYREQGALPALRRAVGKAFDTLVKAPVRWAVRTWPFGHLADFHWEGQGRIRLTKSGWVIVGGEKPGDSTDALPIFLVSHKCQEAIAAEIGKKWYMPTQP
jgi:hypothetical protein